MELLTYNGEEQGLFLGCGKSSSSCLRELVSFQHLLIRFGWYHPLRTPGMNFSPGRKKKILDIFGGWIPADEICLGETEVLPSVMQPASKILVWDFEPEQSEDDAGSLLIPFAVDPFCSLRHDWLEPSSTKRGNLGEGICLAHIA